VSSESWLSHLVLLGKDGLLCEHGVTMLFRVPGVLLDPHSPMLEQDWHLEMAGTARDLAAAPGPGLYGPSSVQISADTTKKGRLVNDVHEPVMDSISKAEQARREELSARVMSGELDDVNLYVRKQDLTRSEKGAALPEIADSGCNQDCNWSVAAVSVDSRCHLVEVG
jgi:hypothetical protein